MFKFFLAWMAQSSAEWFINVLVIKWILAWCFLGLQERMKPNSGLDVLTKLMTILLLRWGIVILQNLYEHIFNSMDFLLFKIKKLKICKFQGNDFFKIESCIKFLVKKIEYIIGQFTDELAKNTHKIVNLSLLHLFCKTSLTDLIFFFAKILI